MYKVEVDRVARTWVVLACLLTGHVHVQVVDAGDHPPTFDHQEYLVQVREDVAPGTLHTVDVKRTFFSHLKFFCPFLAFLI